MLTKSGKIFFDPKFKAYSNIVLPGEFATTKDDNHMLVTILGSCVAACIRDTKLGFGGINHFLLAEPKNSTGDDKSNNRYGCYAMECLINEIIKYGGKKENLEVKLFGGSNLFESSLNVGSKNCDFAIDYLKKEGFKLSAKDLGGTRPRRIHYFPSSGKVIRQIIQPQDKIEIIKHESKYKEKITENKEIGGEVELFI